MSPKPGKNSDETPNPEGEEGEGTEAPENEGEEGSEGEGTPDPEETAKKKIKKAGKKAGVRLEPENIIGDIDPPNDPEDRKQVVSYLKRVDKKLDAVLGRLEKKAEDPAPIDPPPPPPKKVPWYEREFI